MTIVGAIFTGAFGALIALGPIADAFGQSTPIGKDFSANKPAILANLLATIPPNPARRGCAVQNQSVDDIQVIFDNGQGTELTIFAIPGTVGNKDVALPGTCGSFGGRIRVFSGSSSSVVALREW